MSLETKLEKLTAKNYSNWKIVMKSLLLSKGLWKHCTTVDMKLDEEADMMKNEEAKALTQRQIH